MSSSTMMVVIVVVMACCFVSTTMALKCFQCGMYNDGVGSITPCINYTKNHLKECPDAAHTYCINFEIVVKGIDKSYKSEYVDFTGIKMRKLGRGKHVVNGTYKVFKDIDGELLRTNVITAKRFGSAYLVQPYASWMNINNCKQYDDDKIFVPYFYKHTNTPRGCPSPKGEWEVWNLTADPNMIPSVLPYGDYKVTVQALLNGTEVWKGVLDFVIQPSLN